jgi:hypothetical protein
MQIGILADTHNNRENTLAALAFFAAQKVSRLIHCGDITTPEIADLFSGWSVVFTYGNADREREKLAAAVARLPGAVIGDQHSLEIGSARVAVYHGHDDEALASLARSGQYAYVLHGHTHRRRDMHLGITRVINPGALGGVRWQTRSVCVLDIDRDELHFETIEDDY